MNTHQVSNTPTAAPTADDIRDTFVAIVADRKHYDLENEETAWNGSDGTQADANLVDKAIADRLAGGYATATVQDQGNTAWDLNTEDMATLNTAAGVEAPTDEQTAMLKTLANILGNAGAVTFLEGQDDPMAAAAARVKKFSKDLAAKIDTIDTNVDIYAPAELATRRTEEAPPGGGNTLPAAMGAAETAVTNAKTALGVTSDAASITGRVAAIDAIATTVTTKTADELKTAQDNVKAIAKDVTTQTAALVEARTNLAAVTATGADKDKKSTALAAIDTQLTALAAIADVKADPVAGKLIDNFTVIGKELKAREAAEASAVKTLQTPLTTAEASPVIDKLVSGKLVRATSGKKEESYWGEETHGIEKNLIPESWLRSVYADQIDISKGDEKVLEDKDLTALMKDPKKGRQAIEAYINFVRTQIISTLMNAPHNYTAMQIVAHQAELDKAVVTTVLNMKLAAGATRIEEGTGTMNFDVSAGVNAFKAAAPLATT